MYDVMNPIKYHFSQDWFTIYKIGIANGLLRRGEWHGEGSCVTVSFAIAEDTFTKMNDTDLYMFGEISM